MPQDKKARKGLVARGGPKIILERPRHAALLGAIASEFGNIDALFSDIFNLITFAEFIPVAAHSKSKMSKLIFDGFFTNYSVKKQVIQQIISARYDKALFEEFEEISNVVRKKARERNRLIHCEWQISDEFPDDLVVTDQKEGVWTVYSEKDFLNALDGACETRKLLQDFFIKLSHQKREDI